MPEHTIARADCNCFDCAVARVSIQFHAARSGEDVLPEEPLPVTDPTEERVRCSYAERNCLRRDRDGMVPAVNEEGTRQTEVCYDCGLTFCIVHRHTNQRRPENYCDSHGLYHPRCRLTEQCESCGHRFCEAEAHQPDGVVCSDWQNQDEEPSEYEDDEESSGSGYYHGPWREAELLFEGDTPVPGLAEGKRYISFELEEEVRPGGAASLDGLPEKFGITSDGSLRNGVEVTFPPSRMDALVENARTAATVMQRGGWQPTDRCGMHTHIDLRDKVNDSKFLSHLFATFYAIEDILFAMQSRYRVNNSYCVPLRNGWKFYDAYGKESANFDFVYYKTPKTLASKLRLNEQKKYKGGPRYNAFNFHSVWYRGTLEVRLHEGCLDANTMLMWAELLQYIVARVEKGITYPTLRKLLDMNVSNEKLALFQRVFRLPDRMLRYVQERIMVAQGGVTFRMPHRVELGTPVKGRPKSLFPSRQFRATHRRCRWCAAVIALERRCPYCRREPQFTGDGMGLRDERVMSLGMSRDDYGRRERQVMSEAEYLSLTEQAHQVEFAAATDTSEY